MSQVDKMELLRKFRKGGVKLNTGSAVSIGTPKVDIADICSEPDEPKEVSYSRPDANVNGKEFVPEKPKFEFKLDGFEGLGDLGEEEMEIFKPLSFNSEVIKKDENTKNLYEDIKQSIISIDCTKGLEHAYSELDRILKHISDTASDELTNNQLLVLISTMIVKLEELNSYNYPEIDLTSVKNMLNTEGQRAIYNNSFDGFFFEKFYTYYQSVELEQYTRLRDKYKGVINEFTEFQQKKSDMLMILLKWLID